MLYNISKDRTIIEKVNIANSFSTRLKGLMWKKEIQTTEGLMLMSCNSIHTCFMRFPIDVVFLNMDYEVIEIKERVKPWRIVNVVRKAYIVVELHEGAVEHKEIEIGDRLILK